MKRWCHRLGDRGPIHGDRVQERVLIGIDLDRDALTLALEACLMTAEKYQGRWQHWSV